MRFNCGINILIANVSDIFTMKSLLLALLVCAVLLALSEAARVSFENITFECRFGTTIKWVNQSVSNALIPII